MASTYEPIATTTLGSAASSITFSSIPNTYTDLRLVLTYSSSTGTGLCQFLINNDTGTNYSYTALYGNGSTVTSQRGTSLANGTTLGVTSSTIPFFNQFDFFNYAGSTFKTILISQSTDQNGSGLSASLVNLWRSTAAINRIDLTKSTGDYNTGTTATLYGIKSA